MSRTIRKYRTAKNHREGRKGRKLRYRWDGHAAAHIIQAEGGRDAAPWSPRPYGGPSRVHGGMLMSPHNTGMWGDEYDPGDTRTKRAVKRAERARVRREASDEAATRYDLHPDDAALLAHVGPDLVYTSSDADDYPVLACDECGREFCACAWE